MVRPLPGVRTSQAADPTAPMSDKLEIQRIDESRLIKGIFQDNELRGGNIEFPFKKFKGDEIKFYKLVDGQEYELPLAVVKHLNSGCAYDKHSHLMGPDGKYLKMPHKTHRFSFKASELC